MSNLIQTYQPKIHTDLGAAFRYRCPFTGRASDNKKFAEEVQRQILALTEAREFVGGEIPEFEKNSICFARDKKGDWWTPVLSDEREIDEGWRKLRVVDPFEYYHRYIK